VRVNKEIQSPDVRLILDDGEQRGVVSIEIALQEAQKLGLDLVEVSPTAEPPVCRVMDYGKFVFEQKKRNAQAKKKQTQVQIKEIKFRPVTEEGDYQVKLRNLIRFLSHGDKVKVTLRFRGRELAHQELGYKLLNRIQEEIAPHGEVEQKPQVEGRQMVMMIVPLKKKSS
jgi:translation initiation factor IF-3